MIQSEEIRKNLVFYPCPDHVIAFSLNNYAYHDSWKTIFVVYNAGVYSHSVALPENGHWNIVVDDNRAGIETISAFTGDTVDVPGMSAMVLYVSN
jgi:pullulanase